MVSLELRNVTKSFGATLALQNLSWRLEEGDFGVVLGPSGGGKTTLLKVIAGLLLPDSGDILFDNSSVLKDNASERNVGYVPQSLALFPHLTVEQNLTFGLEARHWKKGDRNQRLKELLALGEILDLSKRYPREISGGQQQRVALLRALAPHPQLLLLDEPLGSLDAPLRSRMQKVIKDIHRATGTTTILVSHNPQESLLEADNVLIIDDGRVIQMGDPHNLLQTPLGKVGALLGVKNVVEIDAISTETDGILLQSALGAIRVPFAMMREPQEDPIGIRIPPSKIEIVAKNENDPNAFYLQGTVSRIVYSGGEMEVSLTMPEGNFSFFVNIDTQVLAPSKVERGELLTCRVSLADIVFLWG